MNNMKYFRGSIAYDYDMFLPSEKNKNNVVEMPRQASVAAKRKEKAAAVAGAKKLGEKLAAGLICAFIIGALCLNIYLRVEINEVSTSISQLKGDIEELKSEETRLMVELDRKTSYDNLELAAKELGMQKPQKDQVIYIRTNETNTAVLSNGELVADAGGANNNE